MIYHIPYIKGDIEATKLDDDTEIPWMLIDSFDVTKEQLLDLQVRGIISKKVS